MHAWLEKEIDKLYKTNEYGYQYQDPEAIVSEETIKYFAKKHGIKTDVHRTCINCQIRQVTKYGNDDGFKIRCNYIPKKLPKGSALKVKELAKQADMKPERAKKIVLSTIDPVAWAELMFGFDDDDDKWHIRSYQKEQLRCTAKRLTIREGRRSGKTFAMALKLITLAFNMRVERGRDAQGKPVVSGPTIMIVTPYQSQLTNIFEELESLLKRNIELRAEVTTGTADSLYIKTPNFKMELKNGSTIQGFVSGLGVKADGSGGGTIRGQSAHVIYLDEMDMIPEEILDKVINPILATTPETILMATSTPIGKRAKFYHWCLNRPDFKEDYYPSTILPHWEQIKDEIVGESTKESFATEYMGDFIEGQYGVFRPSWVHGARADYDYFQANSLNVGQALGIKDYPDMIKAIGVDWNKNAGTEFYVIGYSPSQGKWYALEAKNVGATDYSAQTWMRELINLNFKWKPNWIYADEGYGHTIIEDLHLHAYRLRNKTNKSVIDQETIQLTQRLKAYNFSKNVILKDPITGLDIKKSGKHFMVENSVRILEDGLFHYPQSDEGLTKQFLNYVIARRHPSTNKPVYGMENERIGDHRLDAMMLALTALSIEESVYSGRSLPISDPGWIPRVREEEYVSPQEEADGILNEARRHRVPGMLNVLKIMRGSGGEEHDRNVKEQYKKEGIWPETGNSRTKRGNFREQSKEGESFSLLEGLGQNLNTPNSNNLISKPHKIGPRKKGSRRGWKRSK